MNSSRSVVLGAAVFVGGLLASTVATRLLLYWLPELFASTALFPASALFRALPIPIMAGLTLFAALTAFRSVLGRDDTRRAATDAPIYFFGLTILYVTFALAVPLFEIWHYEPAIYGPVAIVLLGGDRPPAKRHAAERARSTRRLPTDGARATGQSHRARVACGGHVHRRERRLWTRTAGSKHQRLHQVLLLDRADDHHPGGDGGRRDGCVRRGAAGRL